MTSPVSTLESTRQGGWRTSRGRELRKLPQLFNYESSLKFVCFEHVWIWAQFPMCVGQWRGGEAGEKWHQEGLGEGQRPGPGLGPNLRLEQGLGLQFKHDSLFADVEQVWGCRAGWRGPLLGERRAARALMGAGATGATITPGPPGIHSGNPRHRAKTSIPSTVLHSPQTSCCNKVSHGSF